MARSLCSTFNFLSTENNTITEVRFAHHQSPYTYHASKICGLTRWVLFRTACLPIRHQLPPQLQDWPLNVGKATLLRTLSTDAMVISQRSELLFEMFFLCLATVRYKLFFYFLQPIFVYEQFGLFLENFLFTQKNHIKKIILNSDHRLLQFSLWHQKFPPKSKISYQII